MQLLTHPYVSSLIHIALMYCPVILQWKNKLKTVEKVIKRQPAFSRPAITLREVKEKIKTLESKKSCGQDSIEMLKHSNPAIERPVKLFNLVLNTEYLSETWTRGL